jgi:hypothetical protein
MYNLRAPAIPTNEDAVKYFLFQQREGYCDLFASSMVLMARSLGIPARYATGFLPGEERRTGNTYVVVQADAHAWAELFFEGVGWVVFDATEGAQEAPDGGRGQATVGPPWYQTQWFRGALDILVAVGLAGGAILIWKSWKSAPKADLGRQQLAKMYSRFVKVLERKARVRRQVSATPHEFLVAVLPSLNGAAESATRLNDRFVRAMFSADDLDEEKLAKLQSELRNLEDMLRKDRSAS